MFTSALQSILAIMVQIVILKILRTDLERQLFMVLKENQILKRKKGRLELFPWDKRFYVTVSRISKAALERIVVIRPETIMSWHRKILKNSKWLKHLRRGRPPVIEEIRELVFEMKRKNPRWGIQRITGEIIKLGRTTCKSSVAKILREAGFSPTGRGGVSWKGFMQSHGKRMVACDFFNVHTITLKKIFVFFIIDVDTREILSAAATAHPEANWLKNHFRGVFSFLENLPRILISDRDRIFGDWMGQFLRRDYDIELRKTPPRTPIFNCYAERMVRTFREELFDQMLLFNENDVHRVLDEYVTYYNRSRSHSSLGGQAPLVRCPKSRRRKRSSRVLQQPLLGGLITDFRLAA